MTTQSKTEALALLEATRRDYLVRARQAAMVLALERQAPITVNDVRAVEPPPPEVDPRVMGAIFNVRGWHPVGFVLSARGACHKRPIRAFRYEG